MSIKEDKMKRMSITVIMVLLLVIPVLNQVTEEAELGELVIGHVPTQMHVQAQHNPYVWALCSGLANFLPSQSEWAIMDFATYWLNSQDWYIVFSVVNYSNLDANVKIEMEMLYNDGSSRLYKKFNRTIASGDIMLYYLDVTAKVRTGVGYLFTVNGRVSGSGMGNTNQVKSQVLIY
jgi:hypothetical protein